jgi:hypothetical protein
MLQNTRAISKDQDPTLPACPLRRDCLGNARDGFRRSVASGRSVGEIAADLVRRVVQTGQQPVAHGSDGRLVQTPVPILKLGKCSACSA